MPANPPAQPHALGWPWGPGQPPLPGVSGVVTPMLAPLCLPRSCFSPQPHVPGEVGAMWGLQGHSGICEGTHFCHQGGTHTHRAVCTCMHTPAGAHICAQLCVCTHRHGAVLVHYTHAHTFMHTEVPPEVPTLQLAHTHAHTTTLPMATLALGCPLLPE